MNANYEQQKILLQNFADTLKLSVHLFYYQDKRKSPCFVIYSGFESISPKMDYTQSNMFLLGYRQGNKL